MKSTRQEVAPGFTLGICRPKGSRCVWRSVWVRAALLFTIAAVGLCGESQAALQPTAPATKCAGTSAVAAPTSAANIPMTAAQGAAILRELRAIRALLQNGAARNAHGRQPATPQPAEMRIESGWHAIGNAQAPVTMIEFTDLQCPFCRRFQTTTFSEIKKDYIDTGKVRFVVRSMPLSMHPYAQGAAEAAHCAGDQGKFWQFREAVLDDQVPPTADVLLKHAKELGLSLQEFQACLNGNKYKQVIDADTDDATAAGIHGTPAFVIGRANGGWIKGVSVIGARPFPFFQQQIEKALNEPSSRMTRPQSLGGSNAAPGIRAGVDRDDQ